MHIIKYSNDKTIIKNIVNEIHNGKFTLDIGILKFLIKTKSIDYIYVLYENEDIVGYLIINDLLISDIKHINIAIFDVKIEYQKKRYGSLLLKYLINDTTDNIFCHSTNNSYNFYIKNGFELSETFGKDEAFLIYIRK